jgi:ATP-dependent RNA helicase DDX41
MSVENDSHHRLTARDTIHEQQQQQQEDDEDARKLSEWRLKKEQRNRRRQNRNENDEHDNPRNLEPIDDNDQHQYADEDENNNHPNAMTAAKRRKLEQEELLKSTNRSRFKQHISAAEEAPGEEKVLSVSEQSPNDDKGNKDDVAPSVPEQPSLFDRAMELQKTMTVAEREELARKNEEERILKEASKVQTNALQAVKEVAEGKVYTTPMPSTWTVPRAILAQGEAAWQKIRDEWHMVTNGENIPPPIKRFVDMKLPPPVLKVLEEKQIHKPTPIQIQGLPVALAGRDMVGIAFTGSGKTLTFTLPMIMVALEEELRLPLIPGEGPIGICLAPSRELARQTYELVSEFCRGISKYPRYPELRSQLIMGGEAVRDQLELVRSRGVHCVVATPGRLRDVLKRRAIQLHNCRYITLDEADRMLDMGFDEEVGEIMNYFPHQRQTLLFSATFPKKFQDFARKTLVQPIVVNVGRAGAANLDVIQEVEYVKEEAKIVYLLHCLQKTAPPVIIFCERKGAADDIHEYLLLKGVEAVSIHGGKDQEERNEAIRLFKAGEKDVLIATDVAAKGLDFPAIQHVINFDMPSEIENYVHRIGRTGRAGKTGVATTFINKSCDETTLLDLKGLLKEARQRIPPVLEMLEDPRDKNPGGAGCSFCGGLGHTIVDCPKIDKDARRVAGSHRDVITGGGDW